MQPSSHSIAVVAGTGFLPQHLAKTIQNSGNTPIVVSFRSIPLEWAASYAQVISEFEKPGAIFRELRQKNCEKLVFAGAIQRPHLNLWQADWKFWTIAAKLLPAMKGGDDGTLRTVISVFEREGLKILAPQEIDQKLLAKSGVLTKATPSKQDRLDAGRAEQIAMAIGAVDVGQGAVVANGLCLACETIQGTDQMLRFVAETAEKYRTNAGARGVLYKGPKPKQDMRIDLPTIGPDTVQNAHDAGLGGVVVRAGQALLLEREKTIELADALGLFIWAKPTEK